MYVSSLIYKSRLRDANLVQSLPFHQENRGKKVFKGFVHRTFLFSLLDYTRPLIVDTVLIYRKATGSLQYYKNQAQSTESSSPPFPSRASLHKYCTRQYGILCHWSSQNNKIPWVLSRHRSFGSVNYFGHTTKIRARVVSKNRSQAEKPRVPFEKSVKKRRSVQQRRFVS